jgi:hypothetical protein
MAESNLYDPLNDPSINPFRRRSTDAGNIIKRFVTPQTTISGGSNGVTSLDDPTYLGFSLSFDILSPLFNGATVGDPAVVGTDVPAGESALGYLIKVGQVDRAKYLKAFIQGLQEINKTRPYYWQTVEGLSDAWTKSNNMLDPFNGSGEDEGIAIGCLEAIDLKMSALFNLYRAAVIDNEYNRFVLPKNLMYFDVYVEIHEIRNFKSTVSWLDKISSLRGGDPLPQTDVDRFLNANTSKITFKFSDCIWNMNESGKIFEKVTNAGGNEMAATSMKWSYRRLSVEGIFSGYNGEKVTADGGNITPSGGIGEAIQAAARDAALQAAQNAANSAIERARQAVAAQAQGLLLGNVFGLRNRVFAALSNPGALAAAAAGAGRAIINAFRERTPSGPALGDNPLGNPPAIPVSLPSENIFLGQGEVEGGPLDSTNLFGPGPSGPPPLKPTNVFG